MKTESILIIGAAAAAVWLIYSKTKATAAGTTAKANPYAQWGTGGYWDSAFGSDAWSNSINEAAEARLKRQGLATSGGAWV